MACVCPSLNRPVVVERLVASPVDDSGHVAEYQTANWETYGNFRVNIIGSGSNEFIGSEQARCTVTHQVTFRWSNPADNIQPTMRLRELGRNRIYNLAGAPFDPDGERTLLKVNAIEVR